MYTGSYGLSPARIHGGSIETGQLDIRRLEHGLSVVLENREAGVRREWRLDQPSPRKVRVFDLQDRDARPCIMASSDNPVSLRKTVRWLILELTGLIVADEFLSWNASSGIEPKQPVEHDGSAVAV
jgi:hypothetical protein